jgi:hypothetical protein
MQPNQSVAIVSMSAVSGGNGCGFCPSPKFYTIKC